jgi:hypothetical protein
MKITPDRPDRGKIDLTDDVAARAWCKKLGKTREEIAAVIEKVGGDAHTVMKELAVKTNEKPERSAIQD